MLELNKVYCMDCFEGMKQIEDKSIDLVLTDPPYGVGLDYDVYDDSEDNWYGLMNKFIPEACRVGNMVIMPSCRIKALEWIYRNHPPDWLLCWYKGSPGCSAYIGFNDWEPHLVYGKNKGVMMHDYFDVRPTKFDNGHPCPKPIGWGRWIIKRATKEGGLVLDPFCGSGTTCVAARELDRNYIGMDVSQSYVNIANKRLNQDKIGKWF